MSAIPKGILEDRAHYFLEYPEDTRNVLSSVMGKGLWPQPADDKGAPSKIFSLDDCSLIPFTSVNRHPQDPEHRF